MKKYLNSILSMAALLMASAAVFTACSSDDNITSEQPANPTGKYTMTVNASKGGDATTRALSLSGSTLNATWATTENVYVKKVDTWATGSLQPQAAGATATLKGTLTGITPAPSDVLTLQFPRSGERDYSGQVGTLDDIAAKYDYATATVTVASVSATGNIIPEEATTTFTNQQAIVKFTLIDKADDTTPLSATQLVVNDGTTDYTITPASATSEIYAAIPGFTGQTVTLTATVGSDTYTYEKSGVSFTNGKYYEIGVKMTKQGATAAEGHALSASVVGEIVGTDGKAYAVADKDNLPTGVTAVAMIAYVGTASDCAHGLAIALADESDKKNYGAAGPACSGKAAVTGGTWRLPSIKDWQYMFIGCGASGSYSASPSHMSYSGLASKLTTAQGDALQTGSDVYYWSSTALDAYCAWSVRFEGSSADFCEDDRSEEYPVRACLAF